MIFPRVHYKEHFIRDAPKESIGRATRSGWMNEEIFVDYLNHVIKHTRCSPERKILIILDNHDTHISLKAVDTARRHGVVLLTIPPHTSHKLQPLDRSVYGPFKTAYNKAVDRWMRSNPGRTVTIYDIPSLVNEAQMAAVTSTNVISGFQATGICPFNRSIFSDIDFVPSFPTNVETETEVDSATIRVAEASTPGELFCEPFQPSTTVDQGIDEPMTSAQAAAISSGYLSPSNIYPIPKAKKKNMKPKSNRKKGRSRVLTDSRVRQELFESFQTRKRKIPKKTITARPVEINFSDDDNSEDNSNEVQVNEGDYAVIRCQGKSRFLKYIARIDNVAEDGMCEGVFLQKLIGKVGDTPTFVPDPTDFAAFTRQDIVRRLPQPRKVGSSLRQHLLFDLPSDDLSDI